jgi:hypothetical protein
VTDGESRHHLEPKGHDGREGKNALRIAFHRRARLWTFPLGVSPPDPKSRSFPGLFTVSSAQTMVP